MLAGDAQHLLLTVVSSHLSEKFSSLFVEQAMVCVKRRLFTLCQTSSVN
jgi:hypothetical protein